MHVVCNRENSILFPGSINLGIWQPVVRLPKSNLALWEESAKMLLMGLMHETHVTVESSDYY